MIRSLYIIFFISICLASCHKDSIVIEEAEVIIPPSEEVEVHQVEGLVMDVNGMVLPEIMVQLIADNEIIDEQISNQNGGFQFNDLFNDQEYVLVTQSNQYPAVISSLNVESEQVTFSLLSNQENTFPFQVANLNPVIDEIVVFNGLLDNADIETGTRIHVLGEGFDWYNYGVLNDKNDFHIPVKRDAVFDIYIENECGLNQIEDYGPYSMSNPIEQLELDYETNSFTISGSVTDCEGQLVQSGEILFGTDNSIQFQTTITNGSYSQEIIGCNINDIIIFPFDFNSTAGTAPAFITNIQSDIQLDLEICSPIVSDGFIEFQIDGEEIPLDGSYAAEEWSDWQGNHSFHIHSFIYTENDLSFSLLPVDNDGFEIVNLTYFTNTDFYYGINEENTAVNIIEESATHLEGSISGEVVDSFGIIKNYAINFRVMKF